MGADLLLALAPVPDTDRAGVEARIAALSDEKLAEILEQATGETPDDYGEDRGVLGVAGDWRDTVRRLLSAGLNDVFQALGDGVRDVVTIGPLPIPYLLSGGMSWGDNPTDGYAGIEALATAGVLIDESPAGRFKRAQWAFHHARQEVILAAQEALPALVRAVLPDAAQVILEGDRLGSDSYFGLTITEVRDAAGDLLFSDSAEGAWDQDDLETALSDGTDAARDYWAAADDGEDYTGTTLVRFTDDGGVEVEKL